MEIILNFILQKERDYCVYTKKTDINFNGVGGGCLRGVIRWESNGDD